VALEKMSAKSTSHHQANSIFWEFLKLGITSFGGPIAHIGYFQRTFVERKKWLNQSEFTQLLALCQFLPGPASSQLGFAIGYGRGGLMGAVSAFMGFTLPSVILLVVFANVLPNLNSSIEVSIVHGLKLVALVVAADAVISMSNKLCRSGLTQSIALSSAGTALLLYGAWVPMLSVCIAGGVGMLWVRDGEQSTIRTFSVPISKRTSLISVILFVLFMLLAMLPFFESHAVTLLQLLYRAGALVFGGGHVVLPMLHDGLVDGALMTDDVFLAGYGASQAIPGPMFSFAAYLGALVSDAPFSWLSIGSAVVAIFLPGFLLLVAALPYWQRLSQNKYGRRALAGASASVVGLLGASLYNPIFESAVDQGSDLVIAILGFCLLNTWKLSPLWVVIGCLLATVMRAQFFG
jgi:chromate transporter